MKAERVIASPDITPESKRYWEAANERRLLIGICNACIQPYFYPRPLCPFCFSSDTDWVEASGKGTLYTFSISRTAKVPYAIAYVTLDEGPSMMTNIVDCDLDRLACGQSVSVVFKHTDSGQLIPMFTPDERE